MARTLQKQLIRVQPQPFADWCAEVRDLAGERWPKVSDQAPTLYAVMGRRRDATTGLTHGGADTAAKGGGLNHGRGAHK
jgi:hypothetical protein